jgi:hypothetical protein
MVRFLPRRSHLFGTALLVCLGFISTTSAWAGPSWSLQGPILGLAVGAPVLHNHLLFFESQPLTAEVGDASMVLYGTLQNAKQAERGKYWEGTTDLVIEAVIKKHEILGDKKVITLPFYVPLDKNSENKFLCFCDASKGKVDPYRVVSVRADGDIVKYLEGALKIKDKDVATRLRFFFDYLNNPDMEVSHDAWKEFNNADYKGFRDMARTLPADKIAAWLQDPKTPEDHYRVFALLLGSCGKEEHAKVLRGILDDPRERLNSGMDGVLAGYVMLKPTEGWNYLHGILKDPTKDFSLRYGGLRAVRFLWESRPDLVKKKDLTDGLCELIEQSDITDLAIEDLRKWGVWEVAGRVLALKNKPSHDIPIVQRAILRYALSCPNMPEAAAFVSEFRKKDPKMVKDTEELLKLEAGEK